MLTELGIEMSASVSISCITLTMSRSAQSIIIYHTYALTELGIEMSASVSISCMTLTMSRSVQSIIIYHTYVLTELGIEMSASVSISCITLTMSQICTVYNYISYLRVDRTWYRNVGFCVYLLYNPDNVPDLYSL